MTLSVIIVVHEGGPVLAACLDALRQSDPSCQTVLVHRTAAALRTDTAHRLPAVAQATGDVIAFLGERYRVPRHWAQTRLQAHAQGWDIVAGTVRPTGQGSRLAAALWEYDHLRNLPLDRELTLAQAKLLPGGNVSYRRHALPTVPFNWETDLHAAMAAAGFRAILVNDAAVDYDPPAWTAYLAERAAFSWNIGHSRRPASALLTALALPPLLLLRHCRLFVEHPTLTPAFLRIVLTETAAEVRGLRRPGS